jgi:hypothetical protein
MKNRKRETRDLIYINGSDFANKCFYSYGIEFYEFMACVDNRPENLILVKHNFNNARWNQHCRFDYVTPQEINELVDDFVYGYGDFCWVDFNTEKDLDQMSKLQIAELLYFGHLAKPLHEIPKVRFAYFAHDDGWFNKLYITKIEDYINIISKVITMKLRILTKRKSIINIPNEISKVLVEVTKEGLFIDFAKIDNSRVALKLPITAVGQHTDMDKVYDLRDEIKEYKVCLAYSGKKWELIKEG